MICTLRLMDLYSRCNLWYYAIVIQCLPGQPLAADQLSANFGGARSKVWSARKTHARLLARRSWHHAMKLSEPNLPPGIGKLSLALETCLLLTTTPLHSCQCWIGNLSLYLSVSGEVYRAWKRQKFQSSSPIHSPLKSAGSWTNQDMA